VLSPKKGTLDEPYMTTAQENAITFQENWTPTIQEPFIQPFPIISLDIKKVSIVIIAGKSQVKTLETITSCPLPYDVEIIRESGLGYARDVGVSYAKSNLVVMLDDDLVIKPKLWNLLLNIQPREFFMCHEGEHLSSRIFAIHRDDYNRAGGFDPSIKYMFEDGDFAIRAQKAGLKLKVIPSHLYGHVAHKRRVDDINRMARMNFEYSQMLVKYKRHVFRNLFEFFWRPFDWRVKLQDLTTKIVFTVYWIMKGAN
jgi:glycosyltransferase involved in cell wall biosynthesis